MVMTNMQLCLKNKRHLDVVSYFSRCLLSQHFLNVDFVCRDGNRTSGHMLMLISASDLLESLLRSERIEQSVTIMLPDFEVGVVEQLMTFVYTGSIDIKGFKLYNQIVELADILRIKAESIEVFAADGLDSYIESGNDNLDIEDCIEIKEDQHMIEEVFVNDQIQISQPNMIIDEQSKGLDATQEVYAHTNTQPSNTQVHGNSTDPNAQTFEQIPTPEPSTAIMNEPECITGDLNPFSESEIDTQKSTRKPVITKTEVIETLPPCCYCSKSKESLSEMLQHITVKHFSNEFKDLFNQTQGQCSLCDRNFQKPLNYAHHLGVFHLEVLKHLPVEFKSVLNVQGQESSDPETPLGKLEDFDDGPMDQDLFNVENDKNTDAAITSTEETRTAETTEVANSVQESGSDSANKEGCISMDSSNQIISTENVIEDEATSNSTVQDNEPDSKIEVIEENSKSVEDSGEESAISPVGPKTDYRDEYKQSVPPCCLCNKTEKTVMKMLNHLIMNHYKEKFKKLFKTQNGVCPLCQKAYSTKNMTQYYTHVGALHKGVLSFLPEGVLRATLRRAKLVPKHSLAKEEVQGEKRITRKTPLPPCFYCGKDFLHFSSLICHICEAHFTEDFAKMFKQSSGVCNTEPCKGKQFNLVNSFAYHVGGIHKKIYDLIPAEYVDILQSCRRAKMKTKTLVQS